MTVLRTVLDNSIAFSLLCAGVWLVKAVLRKHLSARLHYMIWVAVLVSLLTPVRIDSGINLGNLLPRRVAQTIIEQTEKLQPLAEIVNGSTTNGNQGIHPNDQPAAANTAPSSLPAVSRHSQPDRTEPLNPAVRIDWSAWLWAAWLAGMAATTLRLFLGGLRLRRHIIRCSLPQTPAWLDACAQECANALNMRQRVRIVLQPVLPVPAVMGIFHPILAMPESIVEEGSAEQVRHILLHEFNHVQRGDLLVIALLNLLNGIYWFNPLIWLCFNRIRADMETSCDNDVVNVLGKSQRQEYIRTLVYFSGMGWRSRTQAALSLHDAKTKMKLRIGAMYMTKKTKPAIAAPIILLVLVLLLAVSVTGCLPTLDNSTAWPRPSAAATLEPASPTAVAVSTTGPAATAETPAPEASQWENQYKPVLDEYREFVKSFKQSTRLENLPDWGAPWEQTAADMMLSTRQFGYALRDMDSNGIPELFLLTSDGFIWAMYTVADEAPKLIGTFWTRNTCVMDQSAVLYTKWSNGALDNGQDIYRMSKDGRELELIERVAMESKDENGYPLDAPRYYKYAGSGSSKKIISEAEADAETSKSPKNNDQSGLTFVPLR